MSVYVSDVESVSCFRVVCPCGWQSRLYTDQGEADRIADKHDDDHEEREQLARL